MSLLHSQSKKNEGSETIETTSTDTDEITPDEALRAAYKKN